MFVASLQGGVLLGVDFKVSKTPHQAQRHSLCQLPTVVKLPALPQHHATVLPLRDGHELTI